MSSLCPYKLKDIDGKSVCEILRQAIEERRYEAIYTMYLARRLSRPMNLCIYFSDGKKSSCRRFLLKHGSVETARYIYQLCPDVFIVGDFSVVRNRVDMLQFLMEIFPNWKSVHFDDFPPEHFNGLLVGASPEVFELYYQYGVIPDLSKVLAGAAIFKNMALVEHMVQSRRRQLSDTSEYLDVAFDPFDESKKWTAIVEYLIGFGFSPSKWGVPTLMNQTIASLNGSCDDEAFAADVRFRSYFARPLTQILLPWS